MAPRLPTLLASLWDAPLSRPRPWWRCSLLAWAVLAWLGAAHAGSDVPPEWVLRQPGAETQFEKKPGERGVNACLSPDPGWGSHRPWVSVGQGAYATFPRKFTGNHYDVIVHFHGREAARKQLVKTGAPVVFVGVDLGIGSGAYLDAYADPTTLPRLLTRLEAKIQETTGRALTRRRLALTSWSAGYGATMRILSNSWGRQNVDAVALLDGLHTSFQGEGLVTAKLEPFVAWAERASRGERFFFVSHSSIIPPGYASTTTTSNYLVWRNGGKPQQPGPFSAAPWGLEQRAFYQKGSFTVRGFRGNGKQDHCAHFALLDRLVVPALLRRWSR